MFIKYQHVKIGALVLAVLAAGTFVVLCIGTLCGGEADDRGSETAAPDTGQGALAMVAAESKAAPNSKRKDALGSGGWKVNLYEETGDSHYDRAKIDRNRDETWDESWNYKKGRWEKDGGKSVWSGTAWVSADAAKAVFKKTKSDATSPQTSSDSDLADVAKRVLTERATSDKAKDIKKGAGPKINLYDDDGDGRWDRAKIDRERDEDWEEKWTVKNGRLERNRRGVVTTFKDGVWVAAP